MNKITVTITLFGAFRKYDQQFVMLELPKDSSVFEIKKHLESKLLSINTTLSEHGLVKHSVLANDSEILSDTVMLVQDTKLSILPPVCGG